MKPSPLSAHKRHKSQLITPLNHALGATMHEIRWYPNNLPDYLWLALAFVPDTRKDAFWIFRDTLQALNKMPPRRRATPSFQFLSRLRQEQFDALVVPFFQNEKIAENFSSLRILPSFPSKNKWQPHFLDIEKDEALNCRARAAGMAMYQAGSLATDIAFCMECYAMASGSIQMSKEMADSVIARINEYVKNPNPDDGGMFRATRNMLHAPLPDDPSRPAYSKWADTFWRWGRKNTACFADEQDISEPNSNEVQSLQRAFAEAFEINELAAQTRLLADEGGVERDYRTEVAVGLFFYASQILLAVMVHSAASAPMQIAATRIIADVCITLSYMAAQPDPGIYRRFATYGYGKAKLFFLKNGEKAIFPNSFKSMSYESIIDEHSFSEFVDIDFGNFFKKNTRQMAQEAQLEAFYESYFDWPTSFVHAEWVPARVKCLTVCCNPLHRFHYLPHMGPDNFHATMELLYGAMNGVLEVVRDKYGFANIQMLTMPPKPEAPQPESGQNSKTGCG